MCIWNKISYISLIILNVKTLFTTCFDYISTFGVENLRQIKLVLAKQHMFFVQVLILF